MKRLVLLVLAAAFVSGCAGRSGLYQKLDRSREGEQYDRVVKRLETARKDGQFGSKDDVLYNAELGMALHYAGEYEPSNERLLRADERLDELYTRSLTTMGASFLTNSNALPYRGEPHENVYLNNIKALNYLQLDAPQGVRVEVRKLDEKLSNLESEFERTAEDYRESMAENIGDTLSMDRHDQINFQAGSTGFHTSVFSRYLGYISYLDEGDLDDARIDLNTMREAYLNQPSVYEGDFPDLPTSPVRTDDRTRIYSIGLLGKGPIKKERSARAHINGMYVKWVYPVLKKRGTDVDRVVIDAGEHGSTTLQTIEDVNAVADSVFQVKAPLVRSYNLVRALVKSYGARELTQNFTKDNPALGLLARIFAQELTERADLRAVRMLPGEIRVGHLTVPTGRTVDLTVTFYSDGRVIKQRTIERTFSADELSVVEAVTSR